MYIWIQVILGGNALKNPPKYINISTCLNAKKLDNILLA